MTTLWQTASPVSVLTRRPSPTPSVPVALGARSVLRRQFAPGDYEDASIRPWVKLLWGVSGTGAVRIDGASVALGPGCVALFLPGMRHEAWVPADCREPWDVRWCTFDGPLCVDIARALGLSRAGVWYVGTALTEAFEQLHDAIAASITPEGERDADVAAYALLTHVALRAPLPPPDETVNRAIDLLREYWSDTDFGVEPLARRLGIHRSALSRRFSARTGLPPSAYLTNLRMQHALSLLSATNLPIVEVAHRCGFSDADYFTRLFRRVQGVTPGAFRRGSGG